MLRTASHLMFLTCMTVSLCCKNNNTSGTREFYRSAVVVIDTLVLPNGSRLLRGSFVQLIPEKSTEEGTYVRVKQDSGMVYYGYLKTLCWLKQDMSVEAIESNESFELKKNARLIVNEIKGEKIVIQYGGNKFKLKISNVFFDNKSFFDSIVK